MKSGANTQIQRVWMLRLCGFYLILARISPIENVKREKQSSRLTDLHQGLISIRGGGRRQQLLAVGRYQREWSQGKGLLLSRVEKIVSAILSKMEQRQRNLRAESREWLDHNLNHELHGRFLQALVLTEEPGSHESLRGVEVKHRHSNTDITILPAEELAYSQQRKPGENRPKNS